MCNLCFLDFSSRRYRLSKIFPFLDEKWCIPHSSASIALNKSNNKITKYSSENARNWLSIDYFFVFFRWVEVHQKRDKKWLYLYHYFCYFHHWQNWCTKSRQPDLCFVSFLCRSLALRFYFHVTCFFFSHFSYLTIANEKKIGKFLPSENRIFSSFLTNRRSLSISPFLFVLFERCWNSSEEASSKIGFFFFLFVMTQFSVGRWQNSAKIAGSTPIPMCQSIDTECLTYTLVLWTRVSIRDWKHWQGNEESSLYTYRTQYLYRIK